MGEMEHPCWVVLAPQHTWGIHPLAALLAALQRERSFPSDDLQKGEIKQSKKIIKGNFSKEKVQLHVLL